MIPVLLLKGNGLYKTQEFGSPVYVGDPLNTVKIFNEKNVDELCLIDIDATVKGTQPNFSLIQKLANECRMPFCVGGGVKDIDTCLKFIEMGVEKVAISSGGLSNPELLKEITAKIGQQSVVVVLDVKKNRIFNRYEIFTQNGKTKSKIDLKSFLTQARDNGVGELVINDIKRDGLMAGYDTELAKLVYSETTVPCTLVGGAGSLADISQLWQSFPLMGAGAGSLFVFKGRYKAVLVNYPNDLEKRALY